MRTRDGVVDGQFKMDAPAEKSGYDTLAGLLLFLLLFPFVQGFGLWFEGWVITKLWSWFIVPAGFAPLSLSAAIGISLLVTLTTYRHRPLTPKEEAMGSVEFMLRSTGRTVFNVTVFLGTGWVARLFL